MSSKVITPADGLILCSRSGLPVCIRPFDRAIEVRVMEVDTRSVNDPKKIPCNGGTDGDWYMVGANHRVEDGCIKRDLGLQKRWAIDWTDVEDVLRMYGPLNLSRNNAGFIELEVQD